MKKLLVLALVVVLALSVVAFVACDNSETYEGEYSYAAWDYANSKLSETNKYGCKVKVTVKGDTITSVEVLADTETFYNVTASWEAEEGHGYWKAGSAAFIASFEGMKIDDVMAIKVATNPELITEPYITPAGQPTGITGADDLKLIEHATQSCGRLILAVQNALSKIEK